MLDVALAYASAGWPVFPLEPHGKQPLGRLVTHGLKDATLEEEIVRRWWKAEPQANIAIPTGIIFDVGDIDSAEALNRFQELCRENGTDPGEFPRAKTGSGGRHVFVAPTGVGNKVDVITGMDWRGKGGYVVVPDSVHPSGTAYEWILRITNKPPPCPEWLLALITRPVLVRPSVVTEEAPEAYVRAAVDAEMLKLRSAPLGQRNDQLNRSAFALGQLVGATWLEHGRAEAELRAAAHSIDHGHEPGLTATIMSGLEAGRAEPRLAPAEGWSKSGEIRHRSGVSIIPGGAVALEAPDGATIGRLASDYQIRAIKWLWQGRLAMGMLSDLDGDPELGKSTLLCYIASRVTTGSPWPDGSPCPVGGVILVGSEDSMEQVLVPRLQAAGADLTRVLTLSSIPDGNSSRLISLPEDVPLLKQTIKRMGALFISFDPVTAFLSVNLNANADKDVRQALTPLVEMLDEVACSAVMLRHLSKDDRRSNALYRGIGSIAFSGLARTGMAVAKSKEDPAAKIFMVTKSNLGIKPRGQRYHIDTVDLGNEITTSKITWGAESTEEAEELMTAFGAKEKKSATAEQVLRRLLEDGSRVNSEVILDELQAAGVSRRTAFRIKGDLGIKAEKTSMEGGWQWYWPEATKSANEGPATKSANGTGTDGVLNTNSPKGAIHNLWHSSSNSPSKSANGTDLRARTREGCPACGRLDYEPLGGGRRRCLTAGCGEVWTDA